MKDEIIIRGKFTVEGLPKQVKKEMTFLRIKAVLRPTARLEIIEFSDQR